MPKKNILVTGAGGFLGSHIVKQLLDKGYHVTGLARNEYPEIISMGVDWIKCDLTSHDEIDNIDLTKFSAIIHTAALAGVWGNEEKFYQINYEGTINLVNAMIEQKVKNLIYTSSPSVVFGKDDIINGDETLLYPEKYYTYYAKTKSMAEKYVLEMATEGMIKAVSLRPHLIWGPGDPHLIPRILERAKQQKLKIVGDGDNLVDVIHVKNAAAAHIQAMEALIEGVGISGNAYFIAQERPVNLWDFINSILSLKGLPLVTDRVSFKSAYRIGRILEWVYRFFGIVRPEPPMTRFVAMQLAKSHYFKHDKAVKDFGYKIQISIEEGLKTI